MIVRRVGSIATYVLVSGIAGGCHSGGAAGAACVTSGDCNSGLECRYVIGAGCTAQGSCDYPPQTCLPDASVLVLCGCGDATPDLSCVGANATLTVPTFTSSSCSASEAGEAVDP